MSVSPSTGWRRVSRQTPCSVCGRPDWCTFTSDGTIACCMRVESQRQLKNGGWLHLLGEAPSCAVPPVHVTKPAPGPAPLEQRDRVYRAFIAELGLRPCHKEHLQRTRGLPRCAIDDFASTPPRTFSERRQLVRRVIDRLGNSDTLRGVPGFLVDRYGHWTCRAIPPGILIPVRDPLWRIQAFQARLDHFGLDHSRYIWFSSRGKPGGSSPGVPVAFWEPGELTYDAILVTEGALKAAVAAWHLQTKALGVPGVSNWRGAMDLIPGGDSVVIAYDADARTNPVVARHQLELARGLFWAGHAVAIATWAPRFKGIDDAILAGAAIDLKAWPSASRPLPPVGGGTGVGTGAPMEAGQ